MDCPKCGVYNPEDRENCWRCGAELPKQPARPKRDPQANSRRWLYFGVALFALATILRMCGVQVPGFPSREEPTGMRFDQPAIIQAAPPEWLAWQEIALS